MGEWSLVQLLLDRPGVYTLVAVVFAAAATIAIYHRRSILSFLFKRAEQKQKRRPQSNGEIRDQLFGRMLEQLDTDQQERRALTTQVLEYATHTQQLEVQVISTVQAYGDIVRMVSDRQTVADERLCSVLGELAAVMHSTQSTLEAFGFILARAAFPGAEKTFAQMVAELGLRADGER